MGFLKKDQAYADCADGMVNGVSGCGPLISSVKATCTDVNPLGGDLHSIRGLHCQMIRLIALVFCMILCRSATFANDTNPLSIFFTWGARGELELVSGESSDSNLVWLNRWTGLASRDSSSMLIDLGNTFFPGVLSRFSYGSIMNELFNIARVNMKVVTPEDFSQGRERIGELLERARYRSVSTNLRQFGGDTIPNVFPCHSIIHNGRTIYFFSVSSLSSLVANRQELTAHDGVTMLKGALATIEKSERDVTILLCNQSTLDGNAELRSIDGLDFIVCGTENRSLIIGKPVIREILSSGPQILHCPELSDGVGKLELFLSGERPDLNWSVVDPARFEVDSIMHARVKNLVVTWSSLYFQETSNRIAEMETQSPADARQLVGNLLREWSGCEVACFEKELVEPFRLPKQIRLQDLDRLITGSSDLLKIRVNGRQLQKLASGTDLVCVDLSKGKVERRGVERERNYSVVLTEKAWASAESKLGREARSIKVTYTWQSVFDVVRRQIVQRKHKKYDFGALDHRWRYASGVQTEISLRKLDVVNRDSIKALSGVSYKPFSAWDMDLKIPVSVRNSFHQLNLLTRIEYAEANQKVGKNSLDFRLDYSFGQMAYVQPYGSGGYRTFVINKEQEPKRIRARTTLGMQSEFADWKLKFGFGAEKQIQTELENPFEPFGDLFADTIAKWGPGLEMIVKNRLDVAKLLQKYGVTYFDQRELTVEFSLENYLGTFNETAKLESELELGLVAQMFPLVKFRVGWRTFYARIFSPRQNFYNFEPSITIVGSYTIW